MVYNFSAGPAVLPKPVLERVQKELLNFNDTGMSILEISHRSPEFDAIMASAEQNLRTLMAIPDDYSVLFTQGGGSLAFSSVPMNFAHHKIALLDSGQWAKKAGKAAQKMGITVDTLSSTASQQYHTLPNLPVKIPADDYDYLHVTTNNTIEGLAFHQSDIDQLPKEWHLVADMSSNILAEPYDVSRYDVIFAGAQKNIAPAGLTIGIVKTALLDRVPDNVPEMMDWQLQISKNSMYNTPPVFDIYVANLVFEHLIAQGGVTAIYKHNQEQAARLYDYLDASTCFTAPVTKKNRSFTNIVFTTGDETKDQKIAVEATHAGLYYLGGHRSVGGLRASLYNAQTDDAITALIKFLQRYEGK
jgi:phosphoserine aminotransferase